MGSEPARSRINVVLFSGGSGTASIAEALLRHPQIRLQILINAYDDGHSTGRLRKFIPGMLGPSDVRKNINRLMPVRERCQKSLKRLSDHRLPVGISRADALGILDSLISGNLSGMGAEMASEFGRLSMGQAREFQALLEAFRSYFDEQEAAGNRFDFTDCAIGNLLFSGCYLREGRDFNRTVTAFSCFYEVPPDALMNITRGENLFLVAEKEDGSLLLNEADIVAAQTRSKISDIHLLDEDIYRSRIEGIATPDAASRPVVLEAARTPRMNPAAADALRHADVIVYGPGTQHSSLFPSYLTEGVAEAIAANREADKIFIGNIVRDFDIQEDDINDLARKFMNAMSRKGRLEVGWDDLVTRFFVQRTESGAPDQARYIPFDPSKFAYSLATVRLRDWEAGEGRHAGGFVLAELQQVVQARIDIELQQIQHMISIVVPVLNEVGTIESVLNSLVLLNFQPLGMTKEIIVVDGGSTDGSIEAARSVRTVRVYESRTKGRGAALRVGIEEARGSLIAFFPADDEYETSDLYSMIATMMQSGFKAAVGTRAVKVHDLSDKLRGIYGGKRGLYVLSKYGGMMLSITALLLYNRYHSDQLSSVKAFDAKTLKQLGLRSNGCDLDTEICAKLARRHEYVLEYPVNYYARTREQGKKITIFDGWIALWSLVKFRFTSSEVKELPAPAAKHEAAHRAAAAK